METINSLIVIAGILLIPLLPAFIIYKYLPSKTVVKGPFKGLSVNLTGAFSGYFLLVLISLGLAYTLINHELTKELKEVENQNSTLTSRIFLLEADIRREKARYQPWKMHGNIESQYPELTKIFIDVENISINAAGRFSASILLKQDEKQRIHLPNAVCFNNKNGGYNVLDLRQKEYVSIDSTDHIIEITENIKLSFPVKYVSQADLLNPTPWTR